MIKGVLIPLIYIKSKEDKRPMSDTNKYKTARLLAGLTLEEAVEKLFTSESTLKRIERGTQPCTDDIAIAMVSVYGFPWVADPKVPVSFRPMPIANAMLHYIKEHQDVSRIMPRLTEILADGVIDGNEVAEYAEHAREITEAMSAGRDLLYAQ
jgi:transcriptional regulator with XRE-family HTH domain